MKFLILISLIMGWSSAFNATAAPDFNETENEVIFVQTNSTFLITGEILYFNVFCQQQKTHKPTLLSKVAYLELINELGTPVFQTTISLHHGNGHGDFFIPSTFSSGNYTLIAYTRWMRNFAPDSFFKNQITIVNPFSQSADAATNRETKTDKENTPGLSPSNDLHVKLSAEKFKTREKVAVTLTATDMTAVSVSVRKKETTLGDAGAISARPAVEIDTNSIRSQSGSKLKSYLPEIRGHLVTGTLIPKGQNATKKNILVSIPGSNFIFHAVRTDEHGNFTMLVNHIPESATMLFQVQDDDINNYTLKLDNPFLGDYSKFKPAPFLLDTGLVAIINERNIYTQIENAYYEAKKDSVASSSSPTFYNRPDKIYRLDDFTRFPTMEDIFREYIPEVIVKRSRNAFSLQVVSPRAGDPPPKEPLMLIDGVPILNTNTLMEYDPLKTETIEIIREKYFYGSLDLDGILSLKTYKGLIEDLPSIPSHRENLARVQSSKVYFFPDYATDKLELERVPDYRLQLYWNPEVSLVKNQGTTLNFYTSDVIGDFEIIVEGFSSDGKLVSIRDVISVLK